MHSLVPLLCLGLTITPVVAAPLRSTRAAGKIPNVLFLGDSLTAGYGLSRAEAFPALLGKKAEAAHLPIHLINAGVSGGTSNGGLHRLGHLLHQRIDVLVLQLGINDLFRGVPVATIESNLQKIIDETRARYPEVKIVVVGMQLSQHSAADEVSRFGEMYVELAGRNHAALVPFLLQGVLGNPALNLSDLIHPNASGQEVLADNVWPALERVLRDRRLDKQNN